MALVTFLVMQPLYLQFLTFVKNAVTLDFGFSYAFKSRTVSEILANTFPVSLQLGTYAFIFAVVTGIFLGVVAATHQNSFLDYFCVVVATLGISLPNFVISILMIVLFAITLQWLPATGWSTPRHWILPTLALGLGPMAVIARYTRSSVLEVIRSDYARTARAKGLNQRVVITRHILKNALIPVVTILGPIFAAIGTGSFFVESIFAVPGMGKFFVTSMTSRDYNMIMAVILLYGVFLGIMNLVVDLLYGIFDPRIRYD
jgi:ABC-type dipeptide/oligopeptide/nickel transport system permease component